MIGKTFALVRRALSVEARTRRSHLFRAALAASILVFLFTIQQTQGIRSAPGLALFTSIVGLNYWFISFAGATFFASAITEEKEERTLSLLRMANIGPLAILLGKWTPRLLGALWLIAIQIPFAVLSVTLGGVLWDHILRSYLSLGAHLFLVGNLGLLWSVIMPRTGSACAMALGTLFLFQITPSLLNGLAFLLAGQMPVFSGQMDWLGNTIGNMNAFVILSRGALFGPAAATVTFQIISNLVIGSVMFLGSWLLFEPLNRNEREPDAGSIWTRSISLLRRQGVARPRVWESALIWKDFYYTAGGPGMTWGKIAAYGLLIGAFIWLGSLGRSGRLMRMKDIGEIAFGWSSFLIVAESALLSARLYRTEITEKTWSSLSLLPMSMPEIAYRKLAGGLMALIPALLWLGLGLLLCLEDVFDFFGEVLRDGEAIVVLYYFLSLIVLGLHLACWLSVSTTWANWPLAIFTSGSLIVFGNVMVFACMMGADEWFAFFMLGGLSTVAIVVLHVAIGTRLVSAASE